MTLVLGLVARDSIVVASDSQMSAGSVRHMGQKVWAGAAGYIFGLAGDEATIVELSTQLLASPDIGPAAGGRPEIEAAAISALRNSYDRLVSIFPSAGFGNLPHAKALVATYTGGIPLLLEVREDGQTVERTVARFAQIGSGGPFAEHAFTVFREVPLGDLSQFQTKMLATRIIEDAVSIAGPSIQIGGSIQMAVLSPDGNSTLVDDGERQLLADMVQQWRLSEAERMKEFAPPGD